MKKENVKKILGVWKNIFSRFRYLVLGIIVAFIFYMFNVLVQNFKSLSSYLSFGLIFDFKLLWNLIRGFRETVTTSSFISVLILSFLFGIFVSLLVFKIRAKDISEKKVGFFASVGLFLGVFAPGCAACGIGLVSVLGFSATVFAFLPFDGLEISILAIVILGTSILKISKDLTICELCQIELNSESYKEVKNGRNK